MSNGGVKNVSRGTGSVSQGLGRSLLLLGSGHGEISTTTDCSSTQIRAAVSESQSQPLVGRTEFWTELSGNGRVNKSRPPAALYLTKQKTFFPPISSIAILMSGHLVHVKAVVVVVVAVVVVLAQVLVVHAAVLTTRTRTPTRMTTPTPTTTPYFSTDLLMEIGQHLDTKDDLNRFALVATNHRQAIRNLLDLDRPRHLPHYQQAARQRGTTALMQAILDYDQPWSPSPWSSSSNTSPSSTSATSSPTSSTSSPSSSPLPPPTWPLILRIAHRTREESALLYALDAAVAHHKSPVLLERYLRYLQGRLSAEVRVWCVWCVC